MNNLEHTKKCSKLHFHVYFIAKSRRSRRARRIATIIATVVAIYSKPSRFASRSSRPSRFRRNLSWLPRLNIIYLRTQFSMYLLRIIILRMKNININKILVIKPNKESTIRINSELGDLMVVEAAAKKEGWYNTVLNHKLGNVQVMYQDSDIWTPAVLTGAKKLAHMTLHVGMCSHDFVFFTLSYIY